jgi:DNA-binding transcriptional MerR regulator
MGEPQLEEILAEPIVLLRMRSTGLSIEEVRTLCECARDRLSAESPEANVPMVGRM